MHDQLNNYFDKILSKHQCKFKKDFSTQYCLLVMKGKLRKTFDNEGGSGAFLTVFTNGFDLLLQDIIN